MPFFLFFFSPVYMKGRIGARHDVPCKIRIQQCIGRLWKHVFLCAAHFGLVFFPRLKGQGALPLLLDSLLEQRQASWLYKLEVLTRNNPVVDFEC